MSFRLRVFFFNQAIPEARKIILDTQAATLYLETASQFNNSNSLKMCI
jgi:hypothetical protein